MMTNDLALYVTRQHQLIMDETKAYLEFTDEAIVRKMKMYIPDHVAISTESKGESRQAILSLRLPS